MSTSSTSLQVLLAKLDEFRRNGNDEIASVLQDISNVALKEGCTVQVLTTLIHALENGGPENATSKMHFLYAIGNIIADSPEKGGQPILNQTMRLFFGLSLKERNYLMLNILPTLLSSVQGIQVPLPASIVFTEILSNCPREFNIDNIGTEMLCLIFNNPAVYKVDARFVQSSDVWRIIRNGISQPGMICLRVMNSIEHLIAFCAQADSRFECNIVVSGETLFTWSKREFANASNFWQTFITLFTSLETSQSAHVIDPFLAKVAHLFSAWSSLNISEYWVELFCQRACNLGNFTISKRFMHELLRLDFFNTNPRALKFLPKILAAAFTEHRFFAIAHSPSSIRHFLKGDSYSEALHPIFSDLCQLFKSVLYSNLPVETKREFLLTWFNTISKSVYSSPSLSFMLFACSQPFGIHRAEFEPLRIIDSRFLMQFRETVFSHMAASESEFKFLFALSFVRTLISFVDSESVRLYDLMRLVSSLCETLAEKERNFILKTLFIGLLIANQPTGFSFETEFDGFLRRVLEQSYFDEDEMVSLCKFFLLLLSLCNDTSLVEKMTGQMASFIESIIGKVSTNPYIPAHRVFFCVDLIASATVGSPGPFTNWAKRCLISKCEDIFMFFATQLGNLTPQTEKECTYVWKKMTQAVSVVGSASFPCDSFIRTIILLLEQYLASPQPACTGSLAILTLSVMEKPTIETFKETLNPVLCRVSKSVETKNSLVDVFRLKNILLPTNRSVIKDDLDKICQDADILGTNAEALSNVFIYCSNIKGRILKQDIELKASFCRAVEALFKQVREIVEMATPLWRIVLRGFLTTFMQMGLAGFAELIPILENVVEVLYSISQSRHEIWQNLLCQLGVANKDGAEACPNLVVDILSKSLLFGPVGRRLRYFAESYYALRHLYGEEMHQDDEFERLISSQMVSPSMIRLGAMRVLSSTTPLTLIEALIERLIAECSQLIEKTQDKRPFTNSQTHREKHRAMLAILFLLGNLHANGGWSNESLLEKLWQLCVVKILPKEIFTSVRFIAEWGTVLLLSFDNEKNKFFERLLQTYDKAVLQQLYSLICGYIDILSCAHYFLGKKEQEKGDCLMKVFDRVLPACLFNHFVTRARAQGALVRLWTTVDRTLIPGAFDSRFLGQCIAIAGHDQNKPVIKNLNTFIYRLKEPLEDCKNLPILHFFLPRSCELFVDEFAFRCDFSAVELKMNNCLSNDSTCQELWQSLEDNFGVDFQSARPDDIDDLHVVVQENVDPLSGIIQRKLTNWRKLLPGFDDETGDDEIFLDDNQPRSKPCSDLILVASLIDKGSNLGGLCRSADVFGLATVALPSLDRVKDREFESLAVSAHKWLKIIEVPPHQLTTFLQSLQRDGYQLVAAEQATESVPLPSFKFPRKTALILGNEREGIPPDILQLVDTCVEIPQHGFAVRSLNVHVSGALFMYTYSCQHAIK